MAVFSRSATVRALAGAFGVALWLGALSFTQAHFHDALTPPERKPAPAPAAAEPGEPEPKAPSQDESLEPAPV